MEILFQGTERTCKEGRVADGNKGHDMGEGREERGHHNSTPSYLLCHEKRTLNTGPGNNSCTGSGSTIENDDLRRNQRELEGDFLTKVR